MCRSINFQHRLVCTSDAVVLLNMHVSWRKHVFKCKQHILKTKYNVLSHTKQMSDNIIA